MNTAARVYNRKFVGSGSVSIGFSLKNLGVGLLMLGLLASAFGVIYAKDLNRRLLIQYEGLQQQSQQYQVQWSQLLLEQGALSSQARIQRLAQQKLNMIIPSSKNIIFVQDDREVLADNE
jgi:cell division protein FtsL